jgi:hypothetical protein
LSVIFVENSFHAKAQSENKTPGKPLRLCSLASLREIKFSVVAAKNYGRKIPATSFNYVVLAVGQDPGRAEN